MDQQPLMHIGAPPQPTAPQRRKWFGIRPEFVIAAAVIIAMGGAISAVYLFGPAQSHPAAAESPPARPAETLVECANIKHAYTIWSGDLGRLQGIPEMRLEPAKLELKRISENGKEFLRAASGHADQPSKVLAAAVAQYNYEVSVVALELQVGGTVSAETYLTAIDSWKKADGAYSSFLALTCA